jgi:hypothetical protein
MTGLEGETTIVGSFLLAGEIIWLARDFVREAVREHWFKGSVSFGINPPEGRYLKPPPGTAQPAAEAKPAPWEKRTRDPVTGQWVAESKSLREAGTEAA